MEDPKCRAGLHLRDLLLLQFEPVVLVMQRDFDSGLVVAGRVLAEQLDSPLPRFFFDLSLDGPLLTLWHVELHVFGYCSHEADWLNLCCVKCLLPHHLLWAIGIGQFFYQFHTLPPGY